MVSEDSLLCVILRKIFKSQRLHMFQATLAISLLKFQMCAAAFPSFHLRLPEYLGGPRDDRAAEVHVFN